MALLSADRILETSTTTGAGAYTLSGSVTGFRTFASIAGIAIGDTIDVAVHGFDGLGAPTAQFETGTYTCQLGGHERHTSDRWQFPRL
jgi:hypothetical protein